jgi:hypothetical protein
VATTTVRWPKGYRTTFFAKVRKHAARILQGRVLCVDPATGASSNPGWALSVAGEIVGSGEIAGLYGETPERLRQLFWRLHDDERFNDIDVLVIEQLRGNMVVAQLHWSVGAILAALPAEVVCEIPIPVWKAVAKADPTYAKGDEADARAFCAAVLAVASGALGDDGPGDAPRRKRSGRKPARRAGRVRNPKGRKRRGSGGGVGRCRTSR